MPPPVPTPPPPLWFRVLIWKAFFVTAGVWLLCTLVANIQPSFDPTSLGQVIPR